MKLMLSQLASVVPTASKTYTLSSCTFTSAWVQGTVVSSDAQGFTLDDGSGATPLVVLQSRGSEVAAEEVQLGEYLLVMGKLGQRKAPKRDEGGEEVRSKRPRVWQLAARKVKVLSRGSEGRRWAELWRHEVGALHAHVYPELARQAVRPVPS
ncbi:hypothetical protein HYH03_002505 [Edaphochlamys debaryana]|uniref:Uncharacterized protein n=1 Tax=Edaphochlamys debaryana TaxID=47281 RepID=A0A835YAV1_9CHLO|nr:hypothetical protein HYH03_002505 [Edaphochlamys debaryana]|eukprot:KAG2499560.1 hypothetical protein HYH03_002505 [Edaphochlamys debaryana]